MAHHKRKGPKSTRSGCLLCKPHKCQGTPLAGRQPHGVNEKLMRYENAIRQIPYAYELLERMT